MQTLSRGSTLIPSRNAVWIAKRIYHNYTWWAWTVKFLCASFTSTCETHQIRTRDWYTTHTYKMTWNSILNVPDIWEYIHVGALDGVTCKRSTRPESNILVHTFHYAVLHYRAYIFMCHPSRLDSPCVSEHTILKHLPTTHRVFA